MKKVTMVREDNVFDFIEEFYGMDPEWNRVLKKDSVVTFLRRESWKTDDQEHLIRTWNCILSFLFYLGYSETLPGDITPDEAIISVGWCFRNIGDFEPTEEGIKFYLQTICNFYKHLEDMKCITHNNSMVFAQKKLMEVKKMPIDKDGFFTGDFEEYNDRSIADLASKIFVNIGNQMTKFLDLIEGDYLEKQYPDDYRRAKNIYVSVFGDGISLATREESHQGFLDYFLFDYKLLNTGKPLIFDLYEKVSKDISGKYSYSFKQVLKELTMAKLVLFVIKKKLGPGLYSVVDILRQQSIVITLPVDEDIKYKNVLFCAHFFCDDGLVVNFVRGISFNKEQQKKLLELLRMDKKYYSVRKGGRCSWNEFIENNQLLIRNLPILLLHDVALDEGLDVGTFHYKPAKLPKDDFLSPILADIFTHDLFTPNDLKLATQIWADVQSIPVSEEEERTEDATVLAIAVSRIYVELCGVYSYRKAAQVDKDLKSMDKDIKRVMKEMKEMLGIKKYDPRYVNEEGFLLMHVAIFNKAKG